jgi:hypothetical protein
MALLSSFFIKYNTAIPSSVPVEWLFSQAALLVLTSRRNQLSEGRLEIVIILKIKTICKQAMWENISDM